MEIWLCPSMGTPDMLQLFTDAAAWSSARPKIAVHQFYVQLITCDSDDKRGVAQCGPNAWPALANANAFRGLREAGIRVSIEAGAVKPGDCEAASGTENILKAIERIRDSGGEVNFVCVDESLVSANSDCKQQIEDTARFTAHFLASVRAVGVEVGIIEAYPAISDGRITSAERIIRFLDLLVENGQRPAFLHLDVDRFDFGKGGKVPTKRFRADLGTINSRCKAEGIALGLIVWANNAFDPATHKKEALELLRIIRKLAPRPDRLIVQSWIDRRDDPKRADDGYPYPINDFPNNLPDKDTNSLTRLVLDVEKHYEQDEPTTRQTLIRDVIERLTGWTG